MCTKFDVHVTFEAEIGALVSIIDGYLSCLVILITQAPKLQSMEL
jgi:hypothetical protein